MPYKHKTLTELEAMSEREQNEEFKLLLRAIREAKDHPESLTAEDLQEMRLSNEAFSEIFDRRMEAALDGKISNDPAEVRAVLVDGKMICAECYRRTDPNFERVGRNVLVLDLEVDGMPREIRSLIYFCDECKKVFARPDDGLDEPSEASRQILSRKDAMDMLLKIRLGDRRPR